MNEEELGRQILELGGLLAPLRILLQGQVPQRYLNQGTKIPLFYLTSTQTSDRKKRERESSVFYN
jgi:hypothetical protein